MSFLEPEWLEKDKYEQAHVASLALTATGKVLGEAWGMPGCQRDWGAALQVEI